MGRDNDDNSLIVPDATLRKESHGVTHFLLAGDRFGNVIAYDPVSNSDVVPLLSTGQQI